MKDKLEGNAILATITYTTFLPCYFSISKSVFRSIINTGLILHGSFELPLKMLPLGSVQHLVNNLHAHLSGLTLLISIVLLVS